MQFSPMCKTIKQRVRFNAAPRAVYDLLADSRKRTEVTGHKAVMSDKIGGKFSTLPQRIISNSTVSARVHQQKLGYRRDGWVVIPNGFHSVTARFRLSLTSRL